MAHRQNAAGVVADQEQERINIDSHRSACVNIFPSVTSTVVPRPVSGSPRHSNCRLADLTARDVQCAAAECLAKSQRNNRQQRTGAKYLLWGCWQVCSVAKLYVVPCGTSSLGFANRLRSNLTNDFHSRCRGQAMSL